MSLKHVQRQQLLLTMSVLVIVAFSGLRWNQFVFMNVFKDRTCTRLSAVALGFLDPFFFLSSFFSHRPLPYAIPVRTLRFSWCFTFFKIAILCLWRLTLISVGCFFTTQLYLHLSSSAFQSKLRECPCLFSQYQHSKNKHICVIAVKVKLAEISSFSNLCCLMFGINIHSVLLLVQSPDRKCSATFKSILCTY